MNIVGEDLLRVLYKFYLPFFVSSDQCKKHCLAKILQKFWQKLLYEDNRNYNFYKFSYKFTFIRFLSFHRNQESNFQQVGRLVTTNRFAFYLQQVALYFKGMSNSIVVYKRIFSNVIPVRIIVPWLEVKIPFKGKQKFSKTIIKFL